MKPTRVKVKFSSIQPGRSFFLNQSTMFSEMKTLKLSCKLPPGYTNVRDGNLFRYVDPDSYVWVQA